MGLMKFWKRARQCNMCSVKFLWGNFQQRQKVSMFKKTRLHRVKKKSDNYISIRGRTINTADWGGDCQSNDYIESKIHFADCFLKLMSLCFFEDTNLKLPLWTCNNFWARWPPAYNGSFSRILSSQTTLEVKTHSLTLRHYLIFPRIPTRQKIFFWKRSSANMLSNTQIEVSYLGW